MFVGWLWELLGVGLGPVLPDLAVQRGDPQKGEEVNLRAVAGGGFAAEEVFIAPAACSSRAFQSSFQLSLFVRKLVER